MVFIQLLETLYYLERENIVHRDIKLENIIINPANLQIKVIDFGFGKVFQKMLFPKKMDQVCGTLEYMAPEILFKDGRAHEATTRIRWMSGPRESCCTA